ncbi:unnamed protein product [Hydatigera taeniaeformis]|uniref:Uncharacterized protein n=1 Tax=Hydatigena taeniaeformis TaxID=6205 RepID=A0A0R3XCK0_HYDTA|nr:unnamed protein product [Hydatigera taeniaeformis]
MNGCMLAGKDRNCIEVDVYGAYSSGPPLGVDETASGPDACSSSLQCPSPLGKGGSAEAINASTLTYAPKKWLLANEPEASALSIYSP